MPLLEPSLQRPLEDDGFDHQNPLRGVVLCCTSIPADTRSLLATQAEEMGALHKYDLTSEVTHLLVGDYNTPKYRYVARERPDVKVLKASWVEALRDLWIEVQPIDLQALEQAHALPVFDSLRICMTGIENPPERQAIADLIRAHGGEYTGDLTKHHTHLIAVRAEGQKYKHAKLWGLQIVAVEWLHESVERGMILDEKLYNLDVPSHERGKGAWNRTALHRSPLGKRTRSGGVDGLEENKRKLRRTASTRLNSQSEAIWGDIVGKTTNIANQEGRREEAVTTPSDTVSSKTLEQPLTMDTISTKPTNVTQLASRGIFCGIAIFIHGFEPKKEAVLRKHLTNQDATILESLEGVDMHVLLPVYVVVPHTTSAASLPEFPGTSAQPAQIVTEFWIEKSLEAKRLMAPKEYFFGHPFPAVPLPGFEKLRICSTGFDGMLLLHISKAVRLFGATYEESFSKDASVLICNADRQIRVEKLQSATAWDTPVVTMKWLLDSIAQGTLQPFRPYWYRLRKTVNTNNNKDVDVSAKPAATFEDDDSQDTDLTKINAQHSDSEQAVRAGSEIKSDQVVRDRPERPESRSPNIASEIAIPLSHRPTAPEPLAPISVNSPRKAPSPKHRATSCSSLGSTALDRQNINNALSSLLAKSKTVVVQQDPSDAGEGADGTRRRREKTRILGRAASNVSTGSATLSRASSVDSTVSGCQAVHWPKNPLLAEHRFSVFENSDSLAESNDEPQPSQRVHYEDAESTAFKEQVMAKMMGTKVEKKEKERAATIASLDAGSAAPMRKLRQRTGGGPGGYR